MAQFVTESIHQLLLGYIARLTLNPILAMPESLSLSPKDKVHKMNGEVQQEPNLEGEGPLKAIGILRDKAARMEGLSQLIHQIGQCATDLQTTFAEENGEIEIALKDIENAEADHKGTIQKLHDSHQQDEQSRLETYNCALLKVQQEKQTLENERNEMKSLLAQERQTNSGLRGKEEALHQDITGMKSEVEHSKAQATEFYEAQKEAGRQIAVLQEEFAQARDRMSELEKEKERAETQNAEILQELQSKTRDLEQINSPLHEFREHSSGSLYVAILRSLEILANQPSERELRKICLDIIKKVNAAFALDIASEISPVS
jgi:chromosome segregation ATPase